MDGGKTRPTNDKRRCFLCQSTCLMRRRYKDLLLVACVLFRVCVLTTLYQKDPQSKMKEVNFFAAYIFTTCLLCATLAILEDRGGDDTTNNAAHMINIEAVVVLILCVEEGTKFHGLGTFVLFESSFFTTLGLYSFNFQSQR